jgi:hypothetical protein
LTSVTPAKATHGEAADVVLIGSAFTPAASVTIGGLAMVGVEVVGETTITGRSPSALPVGTHDIELSTEWGSDVLPSAFEVEGPPDKPESARASKSSGCHHVATAPPIKGFSLLLLGLTIGFRVRRNRRLCSK